MVVGYLGRGANVIKNPQFRNVGPHDLIVIKSATEPVLFLSQNQGAALIQRRGICSAVVFDGPVHIDFQRAAWLIPGDRQGVFIPINERLRVHAGGK